MNILIPDPFTPLFSSVTPGWEQTLQGVTRDLFILLFGLELIILGVQSLFFKDSVVEYFKMFAGKVVMATVALTIVAYSGFIFPMAVNLFASTANSVANNDPPQNIAACQAKQQWTCVPPNTSGTLEGQFIAWAAFYFLAADASRVADSAEAVVSGIFVGTPFPPDPGNGDAGLPTTFLMGHGQFQLVCFGLGMLCITAAATIFLTYMLLTFEAQVVLAIGIVSMAGMGNRMTQSLAAAFPKYCVTIAVKFFAFYFVVAIVQAMVTQTNIIGLLGGLMAGALVPFGFGAIVILMIATPAPIVTIVSAILVAAVPQFAGSLTSGGSALGAKDAFAVIGKTLKK